MSSVPSRLAGLVAAALAAAAGLVGLSSSPAAAALCSGSGVNVVVDFSGGSGRSGVEKGCDPRGANRSADKVFPAAGFPLTYAQREPGFVCRVKSAPKSDPCGNASPTNAYWGLFWSNGKSGKWTYASSGVGGTSVPNGGFIAFAWQNGGGRDWPNASPLRSKQASTPKPQPQPTKAATKAPKKVRAQQQDSGSGSTSSEAPDEATPGQPTKTQGAAGASAQKKKAAKAKRARASKQAKAKAKAKATLSASARSSASESAVAESSDEASPDVTSAEPVDSAFAPEEEQDGLPVWVPVLVVLALAGAAGGTAWWRRRTGTP